MRLIASSDPDAVARDKALYLLTERAVLTRAVCRELRDSGGEFYKRRPRMALGLLLDWVQRTFPQSVGALGGLDPMVVPDDCADILREIRDGAEVCVELSMLTTADNALDAEGDRKAIVKRLDAYWKAHGQIVNPPEVVRPVASSMSDRAPLANMAPLSEAVHGWEGSLIREAVERTARGVAIEQERLRGSQFLVVTRLYELDLDGSFKTITIEGGHADLNDALAHAQSVRSVRLLAEDQKHASDTPEWQHHTPHPGWPKVVPRWNGKELPVLCDRLSDGTGFSAVEVAVAVIPTQPDTPINIDVINTIDMMEETVCWFEAVSEMDTAKFQYQLPAQLVEKLQGLVAFLPGFQAQDFKFGHWTQPSSDQSGATILPYFSADGAVASFEQKAYDLGWVLMDFDWLKWQRTPEAERLRFDPQALEQATPEQLARLLTVYIRGERFYEGALEAAFKSGLLTRILQRAAVILREMERGRLSPASIRRLSQSVVTQIHP